jgi:nucleoside-diphosphate-sugar epimerase
MTALRTLRRARVLIAGCGDVGLRCIKQWQQRAAPVRVFALTRDASQCAALRAAGALPVIADLDARASLARAVRLAPTVLHLVPPGLARADDMRTRTLIAALCATHRSPARPAGIAPRGYGLSGNGHQARCRPRCPPRVVYVSTTGVYGDCSGARVDETHRVQPGNARARRRVSAEQQLRRATARGALAATIARVPGIYAANRLPLARLAKGTPALREAEDVYTSHIHADDLGAILVRMATHGRPARVINACDGSALKMGDWFDRVADATGMARVPRVSFAQAAQQLDAAALSFMRESRRVDNARLTRELRIRLRYPAVEAFLGTLAACAFTCCPRS